MLDIFYYMTHYPDRFHHPKEDLAFARLEERELFPLARTFLRDDDWTSIGVAIESTEDPLFGPQVGERYRTIPNEWLENLVKAGREPRLEDTIREMLGNLQKVGTD